MTPTHERHAEAGSQTYQPRGDDQSTPAVQYARRVYDDVLGWYTSADAKAQVVLAIDGAFLAFLTSAVFAKPDDVRLVVGGFPPETWVFLGVMILALGGSIVSAIRCLWSRIYSTAALEKLVGEATRTWRGPQAYPPQVMWFFQMISVLGEAEFRRTLGEVDADFEVSAMAPQIHILATNVRRKHRCVNVGFVLAAVTLVCFFLAGVFYVRRVV